MFDIFGCRRVTDIKLQGYPTIWLIFGGIMINMWFTAMFLGGAYDNMVTSHGPCSPFLLDIAPFFLFFFPPKPPDPSPGLPGISFSLSTIPYSTPFLSSLRKFLPTGTQSILRSTPPIMAPSLFAYTIFQDSFLDFSPLSVILDSICTPAINILPTSKPLPSSFFRPIEMDPISLFGGLEQHFTVIWDTGASRPVSVYSTDFVGPILQPSIPLHLGGIASGLTVAGIGTVQWTFLSDSGRLLTLHLTAYYVPQCKQRLLSPQRIFDKENGHVGIFEVTADCARLVIDGSPTLTIPYDPVNSLPTSHGIRASSVCDKEASLNLCVTDETNQNLTEAQKEYLHWHFRLGHLCSDTIQFLLRQPSFGTSQKIRAASRCTPPKCAACEYGKAHRKPLQASTSTPTPEKEGGVKANDLYPGSGVSVDHFVSKVPGRLYTSRGKTSPTDMYKGGCIFTDHSSGLLFIQHQVGFTVLETLQAKMAFENWSYNSGVLIGKYTTDNGSFGASEFVDVIQTKGQIVKFCGVGAHHQNGVAERIIRTVSNMARVMMLHASIRWPSTADPALWPMVVDYAVHLYNHVPSSKTGQSPMDLFTKSILPRHGLKDLHVWGCPCYVLDPKLQNGQKLPRWQPRSRRAIFVGISHVHSTNVPLVLNLTTGHISPQFHVVFDDLFSTVSSLNISDDPPENWETIFHESRFETKFDKHTNFTLADEWLEPDDISRRRLLLKESKIFPRLNLPPDELPNQRESKFVSLPFVPPPVPIIIPATMPPPPASIPIFPPEKPPSPEIAIFPPNIPSPRRSTRSTRGIGPTRFVPGGYLSNAFFAGLVECSEVSASDSAMDYMCAVMTDPVTGLLECSDPLIYAAMARKMDPDNPRYHEAMSGPDSELFREAMVTEVTALTKKNTWTLVPRSSVINHKVLPGTWAFKRKLFPDGHVRKCKARFCVRGDLQKEGIDYFETYAPVVQWSTVRALLVMSVVLGLETQQIDFSNAFCQADITEELYVETPKDFGDLQGRDMVMKLNKSLYGTKQAPRTWFLKLKECLEHRGFRQSELDPCFLSMLIWYTLTMSMNPFSSVGTSPLLMP